MKKFDISDIRNKLNPIVNLVAMIENGLVKGKIEMHDLVLQEIEQVKKSVKYLTTDEEPKYNQELVKKVRNREIVIEVDGFEGIKGLINYIYPDDPFLEDEYAPHRNYYSTMRNIDFNNFGSENYKKIFWGSEFVNYNKDMETKPRLKAIEFLVK